MRRPVAAVALLGLLVLAGCSTAPPEATSTATPQAEASAGAAPQETADSAPPAGDDSAPLVVGAEIPVGARVTVVGDSIVRGYGLEPEAAWPILAGDAFGWSVTNLGCDGGGFVQPGACEAPIGDRGEEIAETDPDVVVVIASSNDLGSPSDEVAEAIPPAIASITEAVPTARLIALDSVWGPDPRPSDLDEYDAALVAAVTAAGGVALEYPDPLRTDGLLAEDGVHPTEAGQLALAEAFALAVEKAGLAQTAPTDLRATDAPD
ncbi:MULTISPECIES: SGNH/GDSL hydrolase family protein [unclassified Rathayibacter]|uniref:SGNH/GDSL hydrolase family protein n=1 Tax=unclassified Rathayibacter TaxID=2609250 RepID=UPI0006FC9982|nr:MULTISPECIES: SGNH/GDSL hydrolase family protein [unclassified Rathayibacter]KQQ00699.1 hypothetical protein ASF42_15330 [Rathayibacter sp. Leaf294]KQS10898.1 hypothetical protein ASG06_15330 [Rathayibacter sp. Leaf185]